MMMTVVILHQRRETVTSLQKANTIFEFNSTFCVFILHLMYQLHNLLQVSIFLFVFMQLKLIPINDRKLCD